MTKETFYIWRYREAIKNLVFKDMKTSYCNTLMGLLWSLFSPLIMILLYWFVFGVMLSTGQENFPLYLITGMLPWNFFNIAIMMSTSTLVEHGTMMKKIYFPRIILPLSVVLFQFTLYSISLIVFFPIIYFLNAKMGLPLLYFPVIFLLHFLFTVGLASIIATVTVFFRDLKQIVELALLVGFWVTPVVYNFDQVKSFDMKWVVYFNPMASYILAYQDIFYRGIFPETWILGYCFLWAFVFLTVGWGLLSYNENKFTLEL